MKSGILYGIGIGPGDSDLITMRGVNILGRCRHVFVPKARTDGDSNALSIAAPYISSESVIHELHFPMTSNRDELSMRWAEASHKIALVLQSGMDACFLTLGDPLLYSTYIYLIRNLRSEIPGVEIVTVPGINAFSAAAALTGFPVGEGKDPVIIVPAADDLETIRDALSRDGTVIVMKVGKRLGKILDMLEEANLLDQAVFVARAGLEGQRVDTDLKKLRHDGLGCTDYLSILLINTKRNSAITQGHASLDGIAV